MIFREAVIADIKEIQRVRNIVKENVLSNPALVTDAAVEDYITRRGKGWVSEQDRTIVGFSIVSILDNNVWALFVDPEMENKGIGRKLHDMMLDWYFNTTTENIWLSTTPGTRAATFYRKAGWVETGLYGKDEIRFEMSFLDWQRQQK
jgi:GNAT superfamily N-acetyltransferase